MALSNTTKWMNTLLNPLTLDTYTPDWFKPLGRSNPRANSAIFHAAALLATYGTAGYGTRLIQETFRDKGADAKIEKAIKSSVEANTAMMNPDPDITDVEGLKHADNPFLSKEASVPAVVMNTTGYLLPALAAYSAYMYGNAAADKHLDASAKASTEADITKLENIYQKANMERLLLAKGLTPDEIKAKTKEILSTKYPVKPASSKVKEAKTVPGDLADAMDKEAGWEDTLKDWAFLPSEEDKNAASPLDVVYSLAALGLGGIGYGSYKITKDFLDNRDPAMRRARMIKKELERHLTTKKPTTLVADLDPRLSTLLNEGAVTPGKKQKEAVVDTADDSSLASMLNTK